MSQLFQAFFTTAQAAISILTTPKLLALLIVPYLIGVLTFFLSLSLSVEYQSDLANLLFGAYEGWLGTLFTWLTVLVGFLVSALIAVISMSLFGSWFLETAIGYECKRLGLLRVDEGTSLISSTVRSLSNDALRLLFVFTVSLAAIVFSFFPPLAVVTWLLSAFLIGFDLYYLPLALRGVPFWERIQWCRTNIFQVTGLGAIFLLLYLIPLGAVLFLPIGHLAAVRGMK